MDAAAKYVGAEISPTDQNLFVAIKRCKRRIKGTNSENITTKCKYLCSSKIWEDIWSNSNGEDVEGIKEKYKQWSDLRHKEFIK